MKSDHHIPAVAVAIAPASSSLLQVVVFVVFCPLIVADNAPNTDRNTTELAARIDAG